MKLIAGSILVGFSLLSLTLGDLSISQGRSLIRSDYYLHLGGVEYWAVFLTIAGVALVIWDLWGVFRRKSD